MKFILLMRHAKSSWADSELEDYERPLSQRGLDDAPKVGHFLKKAGYRPEYICSSTAERARQTTELCVQGMKRDENIVKWDDTLYFESVSKYLQAIHHAPVNTETIMLVGHNPLIESTAAILSSGNDKTAIRVPTAGVVCLESYAVSWDEINPGTCQIKWMMIPKVLRGLLS